MSRAGETNGLPGVGCLGIEAADGMKQSISADGNRTFEDGRAGSRHRCLAGLDPGGTIALGAGRGLSLHRRSDRWARANRRLQRNERFVGDA